MNASHKRTMHYHANAAPFGGLLSHPFEQVVPSHASVSLSQSGGHAAANINEYHLDELIHVGSARSRVVGSREKKTGNWTTLVTSIVEHVNVLQIVTADKIVSQIATEHPLEGYYPKVSFAGSQFYNLRVNGKLIEPYLDHHFLSTPHDKSGAPGAAGDTAHGAGGAVERIEFPGKPWPQVESLVAKTTEQKRSLTKLPGVPDWIKSRYRPTGGDGNDPHVQRDHIHCSLVQKIEGVPREDCFGHILHVHGFGNIFLGELYVSNHAFNLTMLRIEMGCAAEGDVSFASADANGHQHP